MLARRSPAQKTEHARHIPGSYGWTMNGPTSKDAGESQPQIGVEQAIGTVRAGAGNGVAAGWSDAALSKNPHQDQEKPAKVRSMFAAIARSYDLNNRVHSLWMDQLWRRFAVKVSEVGPKDEVLDCACGTGDLSMAFARAKVKRVVGLDFTAEMLEIARQKQATAKGAKSRTGQRNSAASVPQIEYIQGDAQQLPFPDASVDEVSIAFGIRNVQDPMRALAEFRRVLRPGGRLIVLEFAEPKFAPARWFNNLYCRKIMPVTATWISRDRSGAYKYLPKSVQTFLSPEDLKEMMARAGFAGARDWSLSAGICRCYRAYVPTARRV